MSDWRYMDAVREALAAELREDETVFLAGTDIGPGGVMAVTKGLLQEFGPDRVRDAPISEMALLGMAVGAAMAGLRPVVELMFMDFLGVAFDPLLNQAAKLRYMTGGAVRVPMVVRTQMGAGGSGGAQHSQSLEALIAHVPGLRVVMPATACDAAALLRGAIRYDGPVVFVENRRLYGRKEPRPDELPAAEELGRALVRRPGDDITLVAWSRMVHLAGEAAEALAAQGVTVEIVDLRTVSPPDLATVLASVKKTGRLLVVHEAVRAFGPGAEIVSQVVESAWGDLVAPPRILGGPSTPIPFNRQLESAWLPSAQAIQRAVGDVLGKELSRAGS
jgi:2-oxoisovalerate dehydrogenase E1 component